MSVSTCAEIEECPRRWALSTAEYPELWGGRGYPPKLQVAALAGSVVHLALEIILKQLMRAGVPSLCDPSAPQVLRELGGYTRVVEECVDRILRRHIENPRAGALMEHAQRALRGQGPALRVRVQSMLSRLRLPNSTPPPPDTSAPKSGGSPPRLPLENGIYPEVEVHAKSIGWKGKIDLLVLGHDACQITDFRTGATDEAHNFQVRAYAVMWRLDDELNPSGRVADRIVLSYISQEVNVAPPTTSEIAELSQELLAKRHAVETALEARPPAAYPSPETCRYCCVRQLCDAYWNGANHIVSNDGRFGDVELKVIGRHGSTSWDALIVRGHGMRSGTPALLRLTTGDNIEAGRCVRVLDGGLARDVEDGEGPLIITLGLFGESYLVPDA
jgi:hypothetical protein